MDAARQAGRINAGRLATCERLQRAHALLADGAEHSTAEVAEAGRTYAVSPLISELRANGAWIECRCTVNPRTRRRVYFYRMIAPCRTSGGGVMRTSKTERSDHRVCRQAENGR